MEQADAPKSVYSVEAPHGKVAELEDARATRRPVVDAAVPAASNLAGSTPALATDDGPDLGSDLPDGMVRIIRVDKTQTNNKSVSRYLVTFSDGVQASTIKEPLAATCEQCCQDGEPVIPTIEIKGSFTN